jgi:hypothetical protein
VAYTRVAASFMSNVVAVDDAGVFKKGDHCVVSHFARTQ